ncbi:hypothetical protein TIFTF001_020099 [Ficus carica]|uniref:DUF4220 domain-containing protein n=1 Tax=Ficus carica TaxID=3494 RepID=A0AA88AES3_FICCA|nr:hypothetical protein TIFTF001_020099 [Ficus carica]
MVIPISDDVKKIWDKCNLQAFMILSLSLQIFLVLFAPLRKRTTNLWLISLIWSAYLLADWAASFALGLISSRLQDTITAFSLEDNALWLRHFLEFIFQVVVVVIYIFLQSFPSNKLLVPTILMFVSGVIKYVERTRALYLASEDQFRKTIPREAYGDLSPADEEKFFAEISDEKNLDNDILKVKHANHFFEVSKGALVDLVLSSSVLIRSREYFKKSTPEDASRVIAVELHFMYQVLYTKVVVVRSKLGYVLRFVSFSAVVISLSLFMNSLEKHSSFHTNIDVRITYTLLRLLFLGWSESVSCFNMIEYCLKENPGTGTIRICSFDKVIDVLGLKDFGDRIKSPREFRQLEVLLLFRVANGRIIAATYYGLLLLVLTLIKAFYCGVGQTRFQETYEDAKNIFSKRWIKHDREANREMACGEILKERKWKLISEVWVELMAYAAGHCGPKSHAQVLSRGGELISHVWLLMVHFGMAGHFQTSTSISLSSIDPHLGMRRPAWSQPFDLPGTLRLTVHPFKTPDPDPPSLPMPAQYL